MFSQGEANNWYFGQNAGLNFNSGVPVALNDGQVNSIEGSAVMSDANGNLLFYTDGATVWNQNHQILQNGSGLLGELSSTQSALIIQKPGSAHIYYIFTTSQAQRFEDWVFCYSELDMNLDGGMGGITSVKNVQLFEPIAEKITAVKHANGQDIWVLTHDKFTNKYLSYLVTNAGVNTTPIVFTGGSIDNGSENIGVIIYSPNRGQIKTSPDGTKIACAFSNVNKVDLLDFNKATGQFTYRFTINQVETPYAVEFSPNGSLLYVTGYNNPTLRQYNLNLSTPAQIIANSYNFPNTDQTTTWGMQMGPDEKIYLRSNSGTSMDCIQNPNGIGVNSNFTANHISLNGASGFLGLPNFAPYYLIPSGIDHAGACESDTTFFSFSNSAQASNIQWNFGDPASGILNTSNLSNPNHLYQNDGTYNVSVTWVQNGQSNTTTKPVTIFPVPTISLGADTFFCNGSLVQLDVEGILNYTYAFSEGIFNLGFNIPPELVSGLDGTHWVTVSNSCGVSSDTIVVQEIFPPEQFSLYGDQALCQGSSYFIGTAPAVGNYLWQDGSTEPVFLLSEVGEYYVTVSNQCGSRSDTMLITAIVPLPTVSLGNDTTICYTNPIVIYPEGNFDYFQWQNPVIFGSVLVTEPGSYVVTAYNGCGIVSDTITVAIEIIVPTAVDLGADAIICEGQPLSLNIAQPGVNYLWQDGSTDSVFTATESAIIVGSAFNSCGRSSDTVLVFYKPIPEVALGSDISICDGQPITLNAVGNTENYLWQDGSGGTTYLASAPGTYTIIAFNECGQANDQILVNIGIPTENQINVVDCNPLSINGINYETSGSYTQTLVNSSGCDSMLTIQFERLLASNSTIDLSDCNAVAMNGTTYSESGTYLQILPNSVGCDSSLTINIDIENLNLQITQQGVSLIFNGNPTSIQWINCTTGQAIPGANQTTFTPQISGNYAAVITIGECVDTSNCREIIISNSSPKTITLCESIVVSPNPTTGKIEFIFDKASFDVQLFTATGALIYRGAGFAGTQQIDLSNLAPAVYVLQVDACSFKVVKQ